MSAKKYGIVNTIYDERTITAMRKNPSKYEEGTYDRLSDAQVENNSMGEFWHIITNPNGTKRFEYGKHPEYGKNPDQMPALIPSQDSQGGKSRKMRMQRRKTQRKTQRKTNRNKHYKK